MKLIFLMMVVWAVALGAWWILSRYVKSSDMDRLKTRLLGAPKKRKKSTKGAAAGEQNLIQQVDHTKNKFAQTLVDKYSWGPRLEEFLEQAGLKWTPARFVNSTISLFLASFFFGWLFLPIPKILAFVLGLVAAAGPAIYVSMKRKMRLHKFEEIFPDALEFVSRSMRVGAPCSVSL